MGVDGGGTKTEFLLVDERGGVLATHRAGCAYYLEIGVESLRALITDGIRITLDRAGVSSDDVAFACIGLPAHGEDSALTATLNEIAADSVPLARQRCVNDMVCGWAGALGCRDGINIVAGTGSIAYGEFAGRSARAGGWGELFSDEGSAYWVAREALGLFSRMSDGRLAHGPLYGLMREHFNLHTDLDLCAAIYGPPALTRTQIAALAPLAARASRAGDLAARRLFAAAAAHLAAIVQAVREQLAVPPQTRLTVSYSGGMVRPDSELTPLLVARLAGDAKPYDVAVPLLTPCAGAALYAAKLAGTPLAPTAVAQLTHTHGAMPEDGA